MQRVMFVLMLLFLPAGPAVSGPVAAAESPARFDLIDLGTLGGATSHGYDIDEAGRVVGQAQTRGEGGCGPDEEQANHAFLWADGEMVDLGTLGGRDSSAVAISSSGAIAGWSQTDAGDVHAVLWDADGAIHDLGTPGGASSQANAVNGAGQVVGSAEDASGDDHAFLYAYGEMTELAGLEDASTIDETGRILGTTGEGAVLVDGDEQTDLAPLVEAAAFDGRGRVVGTMTTDDGATHAAIWDEGDVTDLGALPPDRPMSFATDGNAGGLVVGATETDIACGFATQAALWDADGTLVVLGDAIEGKSVELIAADGINDAGQIVATMATESNKTHAVLLTPLGERDAPPSHDPFRLE